MKKVIKSRIFLVIITAIIFASLGIYAATSYKASDVIYNSEDGTSMTVNEALNDIYKIKSLGDATANDILNGKTAVVKGELITGVSASANISEVAIIASGNNWVGSYTFNFTTSKSYKVALAFSSGKNGYIKQTNSWVPLKNSIFNSGNDYGSFTYGIGYRLNLPEGSNSITFYSSGNAPYFYYIIGIN